MLLSLRSRPPLRRWLSIIPIAAVIVLQGACTAAAPPKVSTWKNSTGAEAYQRLFWQAVKEKDWLQVESHMASNFTYLGSAGSKDKQQTVAQLHGLELKDFSLGDINVTESGTDAVVTYSMSMTTGAGPTTHPAVRHLAVWQQQKSGWVMVAMSEVVASQAP